MRPLSAIKTSFYNHLNTAQQYADDVEQYDWYMTHASHRLNDWIQRRYPVENETDAPHATRCAIRHPGTPQRFTRGLYYVYNGRDLYALFRVGHQWLYYRDDYGADGVSGIARTLKQAVHTVMTLPPRY